MAPMSGSVRRRLIDVTILLWLAVPLTVTLLAGVLWSARARSDHSCDADYARFSAAVSRPLPDRAVVAQRRERPSGVAVRPSQQ